MLSGNENYVVSVHDVGHNGRYRHLQLPSDTVARHCLAKLFAYGKPRLANFGVASAIKQYKIFVRYTLGVLVHVVVLIVFFKSVNRLQSVTLLCGKSVTTLVSASGKRSSATGGLHSCAETVHFASLSFLGLISSFHVFSPSTTVGATSPVRRVGWCYAYGEDT